MRPGKLPLGQTQPLQQINTLVLDMANIIHYFSHYATSGVLKKGRKVLYNYNTSVNSYCGDPCINLLPQLTSIGKGAEFSAAKV